MDPENPQLGQMIDCVKILAEDGDDDASEGEDGDVKKSNTVMIVGIASGVLLVSAIGFVVYRQKKRNATFACDIF